LASRDDVARWPPPVIVDLSEIPNGTSIIEVAARFGVTVATARRWLTRYERPHTSTRPSRPRPPHPEAERIVQLYTKGRTQRQVAEEVGVSVRIVAGVFHDARVARRGHPPRLDETRSAAGTWEASRWLRSPPRSGR